MKASWAANRVAVNGEVCYVLAQQPKSFAWKSRGARPHPWKQVPAPVFETACEALNGIVSIGFEGGWWRAI